LVIDASHHVPPLQDVVVKLPPLEQGGMRDSIEGRREAGARRRGAVRLRSAPVASIDTWPLRPGRGGRRCAFRSSFDGPPSGVRTMWPRSV
jgi:hypothetical protein